MEDKYFVDKAQELIESIIEENKKGWKVDSIRVEIKVYEKLKEVANDQKNNSIKEISLQFEYNGKDKDRSIDAILES
jgi:hypothetical protein